MDFLRFVDFKKFSLSDLIETLGLVLSRPWHMAEAVYKGGNSVHNALIYYFILFSASLLVFLPFGLNDELKLFARHFTVTAFLILTVTSFTLFCGLRIAGVALPFHKALTIKAFIAGAYVLVLNAVVALAAALLMHFAPGEVPTFSAFAMGCLPVVGYDADVPYFQTQGMTLAVYIGISIFAFSLNVFLYTGVFVGLAPFSQRSRWVYVLVVASIFIFDYVLSAAYAGRNLNLASEYCSEAQQPLIDG